MGRKEYNEAAKIISDFRANKSEGKRTEEVALILEEKFVQFFNKFDSRGVFNNPRFREACK